MACLTQSEVAHYREQGYLVPAFSLAQQQVDRLRVSLERLIRDNPDVRPEKLVSAHIAGRDGAPNAEGVRGHQDFLELARESAILDAVEQLIGPDIVLWGCHVFCKPAGDGLETPWHQDGHYWPIRPLATCTVWLALDASTRDNGCLRVIPQSHASRVSYPHLVEDRQEMVLQLRAAPDVGGQRLVGCVHVEKMRVAADAGDFDGIEKRALGRFLDVAHVGMELHFAVGQRADRLAVLADVRHQHDFGMLHIGGFGAHRGGARPALQRAEALSQAHLILFAQDLIAEQDDEMVAPSGGDAREGLVVDRPRQVDAANLRAERRR